MRDENNKFDLAIIGAGPGGYTAAIRAAQLGKKVVIIEKEELGGTCLNHGCISTKAIQYSTKLYSKIKKSSYFGINSDNVSIDLPKIIDRKDRIVGQLRKGVQFLFKENGVTSIKGTASLVDKNNIEVNGEKIGATNIILATGSTIPARSPFPIDEKKVFSSDGILNLKAVPSSIAIVGAGAIGVEMACIFNELGSKVTLFEMLDQILPNEDSEIAKALESSLTKKGITIRTGNKLTSIDGYDIVLISSGRSLNTHGLEKIGIKLDKNKVAVNDKMQTNISNIYAIGDIAGKYMFAHSAANEGIIAAENIAGHKAKVDYTAVPRCTYSDPGVSSVGLTENEAREKFKDIKIGKFPFSASSKSLIEDERDGFIKIITDKGGKVLGVHILGGHATELISEAVLAIRNGLKAEDIIKTIHAHPTVYESIYEAAENIFKRSIAIPNK
jgi:dihydrolipoamide dehydrogenase